jgi:membrane-anchored protein YejM (alkaline phosphatase superfamily)
MRAYELAARMQLAVPEVTALDRETAATQAAYGLGQPATNDFGRSCLLARRLLEQGVRFVQLFAGGAFGSPRINWDGHENMQQNHGQEAARCDQPLAALLRDLKERGMLEDTLVIFTSEFGRTPFAQSADGVLGTGRDHNQAGFTVWMAGAGLKPGISYGATDDVGYRAVENRTSWYDFHATVLQLLGINHERLTYYHNGIRRRLTNVHGEVVREVLA